MEFLSGRPVSYSAQGQRARDRELLTIEAVGNAVALLMADLPHR
jgi:hypothetical protein